MIIDNNLFYFVVLSILLFSYTFASQIIIGHGGNVRMCAYSADATFGTFSLQLFVINLKPSTHHLPRLALLFAGGVIFDICIFNVRNKDVVVVVVVVVEI